MAARFTGTSVAPAGGSTRAAPAGPSGGRSVPPSDTAVSSVSGAHAAANPDQKQSDEETSRATRNVDARDPVRHRRRLSDLGGGGCAW